jgi:hypothetical protein
MLEFSSAGYALAGLCACIGPVLIHLWNRRRFRQVAWGAMAYLQQALQKQRRFLQLRDMLLLAVRMACVLLVGLALSRPFVKGSAAWAGLSMALLLLGLAALVGGVSVAVTRPERKPRAVGSIVAGLAAIWLIGWFLAGGRSSLVSADDSSGTGPVHAVILLDNSRSMAAVSQGQRRFDLAQGRARQYLQSLPLDSRFTVIPLAGTIDPLPTSALRSKADALRVIDQTPLVDAAANLSASLALAEDAISRTTELSQSRVVALTDLQAADWDRSDWSSWSSRLPHLQVVSVSAEETPNVWIERLTVEDGMARANAPTPITVSIRSSGFTTETTVQVHLTADDRPLASETITLIGAESREWQLTERLTRDSAGASHDTLSWITMTATLEPANGDVDALAEDNRVSELVPVVSRVTVVCIDEHGENEDPRVGDVGETFAMRQLLAPIAADDATAAPLFEMVHRSPDGVSRELLASAQLVVLAGVADPGGLLPLLQEYVSQGGPLIVSAGGAFDPVLWQQALDGADRRLLPATFDGTSWGETPESARGSVKTAFLNVETLQGEDFWIEGEPRDVLAGVLSTVPFFRAVHAEPRSASTDEPLAPPGSLSSKARPDSIAAETRPVDPTGSTTQTATVSESGSGAAPTWWQWRQPGGPALRHGTRSDRNDASVSPTRVLARWSDPPWPWMIESTELGGRVVLMTSSLTSNWNLWRSSAAMYVWHRLATRLIRDTLPLHRGTVGQTVAIPMQTIPNVPYAINSPQGSRSLVSVEALSATARGITLRRALMAGVYRISPDTAEAALTVGGISESASSPQPPQASEGNPVSTLANQGSAVGSAGASASQTRSPETRLFLMQAPPEESQLQTMTPADLRAATAGTSIDVLGPTDTLSLIGSGPSGRPLWRWCALGLLTAMLLEWALLSTSPQSATSWWAWWLWRQPRQEAT